MNPMKYPTTEYPATECAGRYRIDIARRLRIEEYFGRVELEDMKSIISAMALDPSWSPEFNGLVDFTGAQLEMTSNEVLRLALMLRQEQNRSSGWLVFAVGDSLSYGVVRMLGHWSRNTDRFRIFKTREEAEAWLDRNIYRMPTVVREQPVLHTLQPLRDAV